MGITSASIPSLADGIFLRTRRGGPQKGQPKIPAVVRSMMDRGLLLDARYMDPTRFPHLRRELGLDSDG